MSELAPSGPGRGRVRRIVTGVNEHGRSCVRSDEWLPHDGDVGESFRRIALWETSSAPASNAGDDDPVPGGVVDHVVPPGPGTLVRIVDIPPESGWGIVADLVRLPGVIVDEARLAAHRGFHRTDTVDVALCLEGEVWVLLDEEETLLRSGDVMIQRGTYHAWSNRTDRACRVLIVMTAAEPLRGHGKERV